MWSERDKIRECSNRDLDSDNVKLPILKRRKLRLSLFKLKRNIAHIYVSYHQKADKAGGHVADFPAVFFELCFGTQM